MAETLDDVIAEMRKEVSQLNRLTQRQERALITSWADRLDALRTPRCQDGFHLSATSEKHRRCVNCGHEWSIK